MIHLGTFSHYAAKSSGSRQHTFHQAAKHTGARQHTFHPGTMCKYFPRHMSHLGTWQHLLIEKKPSPSPTKTAMHEIS